MRERLAAGMIVLAVRTARQETVRAFDRGAHLRTVAAAFFTALDHGLDAVDELLEGR